MWQCSVHSLMLRLGALQSILKAKTIKLGLQQSHALAQFQSLALRMALLTGNACKMIIGSNMELLVSRRILLALLALLLHLRFLLGLPACSHHLCQVLEHNPVSSLKLSVRLRTLLALPYHCRMALRVTPVSGLVAVVLLPAATAFAL